MRLIDADELKKKAQWMEMLDGHGIPFDIQAVSLSSIDLAPTVDAEPVRYGEWIPQDETYTKFMCSECNSKNYKGYEKYCPNCGAKMGE